ncbi:MAG: hypothetical protein NC123_11120 [Butyrivibrio sp.]|nr:hypothetical protein [Acetatifactor muris]MCM1560075.1 hypothetical protein [Butyrivibrio sp.]
MWETVSRTAEKKKLMTEAPAPQSEKQTMAPALSYEDVNVCYSPSPAAPAFPGLGVIQRKQTTPLTERLREQGITPESLGDEIAGLLKSYDALDNEASTREPQQEILHTLINALYSKLASETASGTNSSQIRAALQIVQDELSFAAVQRYDTAPVAPDGAWEHMDRSPFLRMIAELAHIQRQTAPDENPMPLNLQNGFSAYELIRTLSQHHMERLLPQGRPPAPPKGIREFFRIYLQIRETLLQNGMLSHYTHNPHLTVLHSTDYLSANNVLTGSRTETASETENVSKSQEVDTDMFRNTGFVFFFLERTMWPHRGGTRFGKYRYTVRLRDNPNILDNAWAILHDMAGQSSPERKITKESPVKRVIESPYDPDDALKWTEFLSERLAENANLFLESDERLMNMLSLFLPTAEQRVFLRDSEGIDHDAEISDHLSGNFLQGQDIIDGIALRIAHELIALRRYAPDEYAGLTENDNALWNYISGVIHDLQIMVPRDVMPTQYDYTEDGAPRTETVLPAGPLRRISGLEEAAGQILVPADTAAVNNCFFEAMFPLIDREALQVENAVALRKLFTRRQQEQHLPGALPEGQPVEYQHVQQFADIFGVTVTVIAMDREQNPVMIDFVPHNGASANHFYIRFLVPSSENGVGHYTGL